MEMAFQQNFSLGSSANPEPQHTAMGTGINPWMQVPPSVMPWTMENRPQLVRFGETSSDSDPWGIPRPKLKFYKRKSDLDFNPKPAKIHITEEKMAAQLKNMHISNNYVCEQGLEKSSDCLLPTLVLSKEVQSLPSFHEPLLPQCLLSKMEKPTRALVLWKPPAGSLTTQFISTLRSDTEDEVDNVNNNTSTPDLNTMTSIGFASTSTEMEM